MTHFAHSALAEDVLAAAGRSIVVDIRREDEHRIAGLGPFKHLMRWNTELLFGPLLNSPIVWFRPYRQFLSVSSSLASLSNG